MSVTKATRGAMGVLVLFALLAFFVPAVSATGTLLNISLAETVNQNVTFARDFDLVENRSYSLIEGVITVENPASNADEVYDINIRLDNVSSLATNVEYISGREGYQVVYPDTNDNIFNLSGVINSTEYMDLGYDLDEDGTNDLVTVNDTHVIFNITGEYSLRAYAFYNATNTSLNISNTNLPLNMVFNITSLREDGEYNDGVDFAEIRISGTSNTSSRLNMSAGQVVFEIADWSRPYAILHIPELRTGQNTVFNYNVSSLLVDPPLDIDTQYTNPEFETKVLSGEEFWVQLIATNIANVGQLEFVNITLAAEDVTVTNNSISETFNFTLHNLSNDTVISGDYANVDNSSNRTWYWNTNAGTIGIGNSYNISFQVRAPDTVNSSGTFLALTQTLSYQINTTASTLSVGDVRGRSAIDFNTTKRIVQPQDNNSNHNVTWQSVPYVGTAKNITFTLEKVSLWVTQVLDPNQPVSGLENDYTSLNQAINLTSTWTGSAWLFNFTDGSSDANPPPIVWVKPYWIIRNTGNQIINSSITVNGTDLYMNYIYVVNGYWLEVQKQVLDAGDSQFNIRISVRNRGNGYTPQNLTVTVYDFIPTEFTAWNFTPSADNSSNVTGEFSGVAYQWDVGLRTNISTSFAPKGDANSLDWYYVNYTVNGTGDFRVSDLYIVGLDPRAIDGAVGFTGVRVLTAIASTSREVLYLAIVVFLIAINVANFLMTSKINKKLDRK